MTRDTDRIERLQQMLRETDCAAVLCAIPSNVLLISGYWPVLGQSIAVITREGRVTVIAPHDEEGFAGDGWADEVRTYKPSGLDKLENAVESLLEPLKEWARTERLPAGSKIGYEDVHQFIPASYVSFNLFGASLTALLAGAFPDAALKPAGKELDRQRSVLTRAEMERVRTACRIAGDAFAQGAPIVHAGMSETRAANIFSAFLTSDGAHRHGTRRMGGSFWCRSGPNSIKAHAAYQLSTSRLMEPGELALVHCHSNTDGFWTDVTRTFSLGAPDIAAQRIYHAVLDALQAACEAIRPGAKGRDVDRAAREVMQARGFGEDFKHATGHGAAFSAVNHNAVPRIHPLSQDTLESGMVFNLEPAAYVEGVGGIRQCDMVGVTPAGAELLTPFLGSIEELVLT